MKKFFITGLAVFSLFLVQAQEVTVLDEVKLGFTNLDTEVIENGNTFTFKLKGNKSNDIIHKPVKFLNDNFNIKNFVAYVEDMRYDGFEVKVNSNKGYLIANYDRNGNLKRTTQNFTNVKPPRDIMREIYANYKGWEITKNRYFASTSGDVIDKQWYKLKLKKGNQRQTIKLDGRNIGESVASNLSIE